MLRADAADERRRTPTCGTVNRSSEGLSLAAADVRLGWGDSVNEMLFRSNGVRSVDTGCGARDGDLATFREKGRVARGVVGSDVSSGASSQSNWPMKPSESDEGSAGCVCSSSSSTKPIPASSSKKGSELSESDSATVDPTTRYWARLSVDSSATKLGYLEHGYAQEAIASRTLCPLEADPTWRKFVGRLMTI
jgi:hypothetical protein